MRDKRTYVITINSQDRTLFDRLKAFVSEGVQSCYEKLLKHYGISESKTFDYMSDIKRFLPELTSIGLRTLDNSKYEICQSYPMEVIIPEKFIGDIVDLASVRNGGRIPGNLLLI
jgi:hypothetical protein